MRNIFISMALLLSFATTTWAQDSEKDAKAQSDAVAEAVATYNKYGAQPYKGKKILSLGDSYTYQNNYGAYLAKATGCTQRGRGYNGASLKWFVANEYMDPTTGMVVEEKFDANLLNQYDIITVMGGTNNWGTHCPIGTIDDAPGIFTIYGETKYVIETILKLKPNAKLYFCTQPFRDNNNMYHDGYGRYELNERGVTLEQTMDAIRDCCAHYGIPCFDFYHLCGWNDYNNIEVKDPVHPANPDPYGGNILTIDGLHPRNGDGNGADQLGTTFGRFINEH